MQNILNKISKEMMFDFDKNKKIGHIRCQFGDSKLIANQFIAVDGSKELIIKNNIKIEEINKIVNKILNEWIKNYDQLEELCEGEDCNKKETNYFLQNENVNFWININAIGTKEYNCYIHIYHF